MRGQKQFFFAPKSTEANYNSLTRIVVDPSQKNTETKQTNITQTLETQFWLCFFSKFEVQSFNKPVHSNCNISDANYS